MSDQEFKKNDVMGSVYDVQHLATFTIGLKQGLLKPEDGMKKLRIMEKSQGIWTMDCELMIDKKYLVILDKKSGQEVELIPLGLIHEPTSVISEDKKDIYSNVLLFTVLEDPKKKASIQSEMHIFQCIKNHSSEVVDAIIKSKELKSLTNSGKKVLDVRYPIDNEKLLNEDELESQEKNGEYDLRNISENFQFRSNLLNNSSGNKRFQINNNAVDSFNNSDEQQKQIILQSSAASNSGLQPIVGYSPYSESIDQDVQILNHCFDDIERFVTRLQNASEHYKELERRRKQRKSRKKLLGEGLLSLRAQMPPQQHFYDIFQKFKLSFNLLAKLKAHIHDPNAPELIHFLFTPLSLIINASKDLQSNRGLTKTVWSPLLTKSAKELLLNCLTSKEQDLWQSLGEAWTISKEESKLHSHYQYIEPYSPIFYDGWAPNLENLDTRSEISRLAVSGAPQPVQQLVMQKPKLSSQPQANKNSGILVSNSRSNSASQQGLNQSSPRLIIENNQKINSSSSHQYEDEIKEWATNLHLRGIRVCEVLHERRGNNDKELNVRANELLEVLDDKRKWWRVKNFYGQIGHVPHTIIRPCDFKINYLAEGINANNDFNNQELEKAGYF